MSTRVKIRGSVKDSYLNLVMKFPLISIKSEAQWKTAQTIIDQLLAKGILDDGETMYLDALSDLLAAYEDLHYPIAPATYADMLRHLMEAKRVTEKQADTDENCRH